MEISEYTVDRRDGEGSGTLSLTVEHDGVERTVQFEFVERGNPPNVHAPFPGQETKIFAWPAEGVPSELQVEAESDDAVEAAMLENQLPEGIELLHQPYDECDDGVRSPFVNYS